MQEFNGDPYTRHTSVCFGIATQYLYNFAQNFSANRVQAQPAAIYLFEKPFG